jgi:diacylglycerol kinase (ATP)
VETASHRERIERIPALTENVCVIVNPAAGRGRGAKLLPEVQAEFGKLGAAEVVTTAHPTDEQRLAREAILAGCRTIVCVGGDGTCGNIANVILTSGAAVRLGVIAAGTGNDFARTLRVDKMSPARVALLCRNPFVNRMDIGKIEDKLFLNSCGFGFDVAVLQGLARARWLGNNMVYIYSALQQILSYGGVQMKISSSVTERDRALHLLVVFANGSRFGGGLAIAPSATVTDSMLDAVMIRDASRARRLRMLAAAKSGEHGKFGEVTMERARRFSLEFEEPPFYECDGEVHQAKSATLTVECIHAALRVVAPEGFAG